MYHLCVGKIAICYKLCFFQWKQLSCSSSKEDNPPLFPSFLVQQLSPNLICCPLWSPHILGGWRLLRAERQAEFLKLVLFSLSPCRLRIPLYKIVYHLVANAKYNKCKDEGHLSIEKWVDHRLKVTTTTSKFLGTCYHFTPRIKWFLNCYIIDFNHSLCCERCFC